MKLEAKTRKNKASVIALVILAVVLLIGGTLAYFTYQATINNKIKTGSVDVSTIEKFDPPENPEAGAEIEKKVAVMNNSTFPLMVRIKLTPVWTKDSATLSNTFDSTWAAEPGNGGTDLAATPVLATDTSSNWLLAADGYYYLTNPLAAKGTTATYSPAFLDHVKLHDNIFGTADEKQAYYQEALYTLSVTVEAIEASDESIDASGWTIPEGVSKDITNAVGSNTEPFTDYQTYASGYNADAK